MLSSTGTLVRGGARKRRSQGVSLIELLIAIGILVILAALAFPVVKSVKENGRTTVCLAHMRELASLITQYSADNNNRLLPALSGQNAWMNDTTWYEAMDEMGLLPGSPYAVPRTGPDWAGSRSSVMACPSRDEPPYPHRVGGKHAIHYTVNQNPGFLNRVNLSSGQWPTLSAIAKPSRTFLLGEISGMIGYPDGENFVYPHPRKGNDLREGAGLNLVFYDGHAEYFKGKLPALPGQNYSVIPYDSVSPEMSFPWY